MLKQIRDARIDMKTGIVIIALALLVWAMVVFVNIRDMVPEEMRTPVDTTAGR